MRSHLEGAAKMETAPANDGREPHWYHSCKQIPHRSHLTQLWLKAGAQPLRTIFQTQSVGPPLVVTKSGWRPPGLIICVYESVWHTGAVMSKLVAAVGCRSPRDCSGMHSVHVMPYHAVPVMCSCSYHAVPQLLMFTYWRVSCKNLSRKSMVD